MNFRQKKKPFAHSLGGQAKGTQSTVTGRLFLP